MSKIVKISILVFLILDVSFIVFLSQNNNKINKDNERLVIKNKEMSDKVVEILSNEEVPVLKQECEFTATYRVVDNLKYEGEDDQKYVILDSIKSKRPFILSYKDFTFEKNENYEIKFRGTEDSKLGEYKIMTITKTEKEALEQINETCTL